MHLHAQIQQYKYMLQKFFFLKVKHLVKGKNGPCTFNKLWFMQILLLALSGSKKVDI